MVAVKGEDSLYGCRSLKLLLVLASCCSIVTVLQYI